jgi:hypothetical protein
MIFFPFFSLEEKKQKNRALLIFLKNLQINFSDDFKLAKTKYSVLAQTETRPAAIQRLN